MVSALGSLKLEIVLCYNKINCIKLVNLEKGMPVFYLGALIYMRNAMQLNIMFGTQAASTG